MSGKDPKKQNFRERIRSMRENWSDGPLLASSEDITDVENDSLFISACKNRRGKKAKPPELENEPTDENDSTAPSMLVPFCALSVICYDLLILFRHAQIVAKTLGRNRRSCTTR